MLRAKYTHSSLPSNFFEITWGGIQGKRETPVRREYWVSGEVVLTGPEPLGLHTSMDVTALKKMGFVP